MPTKFEVSISVHYEDMKRDTKCGKWGGLGYYGATKVTENSDIGYSTYEFLLTFHTTSVPILYRF